MLKYAKNVCNYIIIIYASVGLPSKFHGSGNVGTTNSPRYVGTVSLMLFSLVHQKTCFSSVTCEMGMCKYLKKWSEVTVNKNVELYRMI